MRHHFICICIALSLACFAAAQQPPQQPTKTNSDKGGKSSNTSAEAKLKDLFESKIKTEWEALKKKDSKTYGELLADDYQGVETDGKGERTRIAGHQRSSGWQHFRLHVMGIQINSLESRRGVRDL